MRAGRLAPTPSGDLHLGNITAFYAAWLSARQSGARVLLRMEDVDSGRSRADVETRQRATLQWLGLTWDAETPRQSERSYAAWADALGHHAYRCTCSRKQLKQAGGRCAMGCRHAKHGTGALRFAAPSGLEKVLDRRHGPQNIAADAHEHPVLVRGDGLVAYPLAVVVDDIRDGVTEVVRGDDLLDFTGAQQALWRALGATPPSWLHTPLVLGPDGRKLSKSHDSAHIDGLRAAGWTASDVLRLVGTWLGLHTADLHDAVADWRPADAVRGSIRVTCAAGVAPGDLTWTVDGA